MEGKYEKCETTRHKSLQGSLKKRRHYIRKNAFWLENAGENVV